jgi:maltoporin
MKKVRSKARSIIVTLAALFMLWWPSAGFADEVSDLRQDMEQMQKRLDQLEAEKKEMADEFKSFEFHGYSRAGFGWNDDGGTGNRFRWNSAAGGDDDHYWRLGNESHNHYTNLTLVKNIKTDDQSFAKFLTSVIIEPRGEDNWEENKVVIRQLYAEAGNFSWAPGVTFWAGQKWYRHPEDQHITDWQFLDIAGYGGGVGDIPLGGFGKLSIAALGFIDEGDLMTIDNGEPASYVVDLRIEQIPMGDIGNILVQFAPTWTTGGELTAESQAETGETELDSESGWMSALYLNFDDFFGMMEGGYGRLILRYGSGYGSQLFNTGYRVPNPVRADVDWEDSSRWSVAFDGLMEISPNLQIMPVIAYYQFDNGLEQNNEIKKLLYGGRAKYAVNDNFALQLEAGAIYLDSEPSTTASGHLEDTLYKVTFAPTIQPAKGFMVRPEIRFFVTYAWWDDEESNAYLDDAAGIESDDTSGLTYGIQMEVWW